MSLGNLVPSKFQINVISKKDMEIANYTDENALITVNPEIPYFHTIMDQSLDYIASASPSIYASDGGLYKAFNNSNSVREVPTDVVRWKMKGTGKTKVISLENLMTGNPTPGINHSIVHLKLNKNIYQSSDTIYPEHEPSLRFSVQGNPVADGTGWIYSLVLHDRYDNSYVDPAYLASNVIWCSDGGSVSEGSGEYGSTWTQGTSILVYESSLTSFAQQHEVTDKAYLYTIRLKAKNSKGQDMKGHPDLIMGVPEAEFLAQARYKREHKLFWGRSAGKSIADVSTGLYRRIGEGMIEFYEDGNTRPYHRNKFSTSFLKDIFRRFFYGKVKPGNANIKVQAGLGLMGLVDDALNKEYATIPVERRWADHVKPGSSYNGSATKGLHLSAPTFLGFDLKPYGTIEFVHLPLLDDIEMNGGRVDKKTGKPETSFWGLVSDLGIGTGNNVELLRQSNSEFYNYVCGMLSPVGFINRRKGSNTGFSSSHSKRSYSVHMGVTEGVRVKDTKRTMFIYPAERF